VRMPGFSEGGAPVAIPTSGDGRGRWNRKSRTQCAGDSEAPDTVAS